MEKLDWSSCLLTPTGHSNPVDILATHRRPSRVTHSRDEQNFIDT